MSFPVRILKQWRVHEIHVSLCQLGKMRRIIKSPVTDKENMEIDRILAQAHICTDTCAISTVVKLDWESYWPSKLMQPREARTSKLICDTFRLYELQVSAKLLQPKLLCTEIYKKDAEQATYNAHNQGVCKRLSQQMKQNQECFAQVLRTTAFGWKNKCQLWKLRSRLSESVRREFESESDMHFLN